jgi:hypothetical protein
MLQIEDWTENLRHLPLWHSWFLEGKKYGPKSNLTVKLKKYVRKIYNSKCKRKRAKWVIGMGYSQITRP